MQAPKRHKPDADKQLCKASEVNGGRRRQLFYLLYNKIQCFPVELIQLVLDYVHFEWALFIDPRGLLPVGRSIWIDLWPFPIGMGEPMRLRILAIDFLDIKGRFREAVASYTASHGAPSIVEVVENNCIAARIVSDWIVRDKSEVSCAAARIEHHRITASDFEGCEELVESSRASIHIAREACLIWRESERVSKLFCY
jgi:hypothetical protein